MRSARNAEEKLKTRELILDATEIIMREQGYAAVSSRRVAAEAGLKSQLVHYHFGTMDDLFLALFQRAESRHFDALMEAMKAPSPLRKLWELNTDRSGMSLIFEFMALANHRPPLREEIARANIRARRLNIALLSRALKDSKVDTTQYPPEVVSIMLSGTAFQLVSEGAIGVTEAHAETFDYVEGLIAQIEQSKG